MFLAAVLGALIFYIAYQGWLAWIFLMVVLWLPVLSLAVSLPAMLTVQLTVLSAGTVSVGAKVYLSVDARCRLPMPVYRCRVRVSRPITGESWLLAPGEALPAEHGGALVCQTENALVYDCLGLFRRKIRRANQAQTLVRPMPIPVTAPSDLERYVAQAWRPKHGGGFAENHELRLYRPGDHLNQVHWKLSAKTGKLIVREAMEPVRQRVLLTVDISGSAGVLDRKLGQLLWMGQHLLEREMRYEIQAMTDTGLRVFPVSSEETLLEAVDALLGCGPAQDSIRNVQIPSSWHFHIGGDGDED